MAFVNPRLFEPTRMKMHEDMITHMWCRKEDPTDDFALNETFTLLLHVEHTIVG